MSLTRPLIFIIVMFASSVFVCGRRHCRGHRRRFLRPDARATDARRVHEVALDDCAGKKKRWTKRSRGQEVQRQECRTLLFPLCL